jgi:hypothetical protein
MSSPSTTLLLQLLWVKHHEHQQTQSAKAFSTHRYRYIHNNSIRNRINGERYRSFSQISSSNDETGTTSDHSTNPGSSTSGDGKDGRRKNTDNSFLVVNLEKKVVTEIYNSAQDILNRFNTAVQRPRQVMEKQYGTTNYIDESNQPLIIEPRDRDEFELIIFSGGTALNTVPANILQSFYDQLVDRLDFAGIVTEGKQLKDGNIAHPDDYWLRVNEFKLFPPNKKNLLVITFQASIAWMCIYEDIQLIANKIPELPQRPLAKNQVLRWLPLAVVADMQGGTGRFSKEQIIFNNLVSDWPIDIASDHQTISMGGKVPQQVPDLDWNFHDKLRMRPPNEKEVFDDIKKEFWKVPPITTTR